jgi:sigma-B regulation protein RsbU (phosphoserine phosphatase)
VNKPSRILVVDDEPGMLRAVERVLGDTHRVLGSRSSRDAVALASGFNPELAIVDIRMPEVDGFELMSRLKTRFPDLDIILMTGSVDDLDEKLVRAIRSPAFYFIQKPFDREVLKTLVGRCLELRWRREEHRRHVQQLEMQIAEARAFQQSLLPDAEATLNGSRIACRYTPCSSLGGDLYDYAPGDSGQTALLIADVSGHGVSAAMLTAIVKSAFHSSGVDGYEPLAVVQRVWNGLGTFSPERFVTLIAALIVPREGRLRYVNAGHPPGVLWGDRQPATWLASTGPLISPVLAQLKWEVETVAFEPNDRVLLYTDGVSEVLARSDDGADAEIVSAIERTRDGGPRLLDAMLEDVAHALGGRPQPDDLTLLTASLPGS